MSSTKAAVRFAARSIGCSPDVLWAAKSGDESAVDGMWKVIYSLILRLEGRGPSKRLKSTLPQVRAMLLSWGFHRGYSRVELYQESLDDVPPRELLLFVGWIVSTHPQFSFTKQLTQCLSNISQLLSLVPAMSTHALDHQVIMQFWHNHSSQ
eukprot:m.189651 g.189651  ORF g.189651 m.189651 type:complete len:152 (+) comp14798_c0_seq5:303-758(+)